MKPELLVAIALVMALGIITVVAVEFIMTAQEAEAKCAPGGVAFNASKGRCIR